MIVPSHDNSGNVLPTGGTDTGGKSFLTDYKDKLGAVYDRMDDRDIRKQTYVYNPTTGTYDGIFLKGAMKANFGKGAALKADADREDRKSTRLNSSHANISYAVFCLKKYINSSLDRSTRLCMRRSTMRSNT